jgi:hypothetical protein
MISYTPILSIYPGTFSHISAICGQMRVRLRGVSQLKYWVRNVERKPTSFSLQTSTDCFYPGFICKLEDDRILIVEYKNSRDWELPDNDEKRKLGALVSPYCLSSAQRGGVGATLN